MLVVVVVLVVVQPESHSANKATGKKGNRVPVRRLGS